MGADRKTAAVRERELRQALVRIQRGRAKTKATKATIAAVAREAGVTPALIHNHYPGIAEAIRAAAGRTSEASREVKDQELKRLRIRIGELNAEVKALRGDVARLASLNETLVAANAVLKGKAGQPALLALANSPRSGSLRRSTGAAEPNRGDSGLVGAQGPHSPDERGKP